MPPRPISSPDPRTGSSAGANVRSEGDAVGAFAVGVADAEAGGGDPDGDDVGPGLAADAQAATTRPTRIFVANRETEERVPRISG